MNCAIANRGLAAKAIGSALLKACGPVLAIAIAFPAFAQADLSGARASSFTYYPNGLLQSETIEPGTGDENYCVSTTYTYAAWGNKNGATTANCPGASVPALFTARSSTSNFAAQTVTVAGVAGVLIPAGQFATSASNALLKSETRLYDPRFGAVTSLTGPNALTTTFEHDDFGRKVKETRADGTSSWMYYCILSSLGLDTTSNTTSITNTAVSVCTSGPLSGQTIEIPSNAVSFVQSESKDANGVKMGPSARTYKDRQGRSVREVSESFDGGGQPSDRRHVMKDTAYNQYGVAVLSTAPYFVGARSSTVTSNSDVGVTLTKVDALGRPIQVDISDPAGNVASTDLVAPGAFVVGRVARTTMAYNGLSSTTVNPKGQSRIEEKNADGKLVRITDAYGGQVVHQHDAFGNLLKTKDALQNIVSIGYDKRGRKTSMNDPDTGNWTYTYNALGELVEQKSPNQVANGTVTRMVYDVLGRMTSRVEPEYTSSWTYDACNKGIGKLCESNTSNGVNKKVVYDALGRPINSRTTVTNGPSFATAMEYDAPTGRVKFQTYPTGVKVKYVYTQERGFLSNLVVMTDGNIAPLPASVGGAPAAGKPWYYGGTAVWSAGTVNAWGKSESQLLNDSGVTTRTSFEPRTGRILATNAGIGAASNLLNHSYTWDSLNNLMGRTDANGDGNTGAVTDEFVYDSINRLTQYKVSAPQVPNLQRTVDLQYNAMGNLLYKTDVGAYSYPAYGAGSNKPHAVSQVQGSVIGTVSYGYDNNGNMTSANGGMTTPSGGNTQKYRNVSYTSFNLPDGNLGLAGANGTPRYTWQYDESHQRISETRVNNNGARVTWYQPGFESDGPTTGPNNHRHYLSAGGQTIVLVTKGALPALGASLAPPANVGGVTFVKVEYWHKDHLGSLVATSDHTGGLTKRYSYDPFGKRRETNGSYDPFGNIQIDWSDNVNHGTDRGYTGHEHLDDVGVIHMNGRIFDPTIARFMQGDPFIQDPSNLQNYNRYTYCYNNPLTCTDPSGYYSFNDFHRQQDKFFRNPTTENLNGVFQEGKFAAGFGGGTEDRWLSNKYVRIAAIIVAAYFTGGAALEAYASAAGTAATSGYAAATISAEAWAVEGAALSFSASAAAASSVAGGAIAGAAGGFAGSFLGSDLKIQAGLKGAATGALSGGINNYYGSSYTAGRILANGMAGGAGAVLRGESFSSGFRTSAIISSLAYLNSAMRGEMISQSNIDQGVDNSNGSGLSGGMYGDGYKLAGGRWFFGASRATCSEMGCFQSGPGSNFGISYSKGGLIDLINESFAGPHDKANSFTWYVNNDREATLLNFLNKTDAIVPGQALPTGYYGALKTAIEVTTNYSTSLIFALPFAGAAIIEQTWAMPGLKQSRGP
jgi:RHS repeat-associated protein